jgi:pimeloyl-ACP methyl ester carboxylesterase
MRISILGVLVLSACSSRPPLRNPVAERSPYVLNVPKSDVVSIRSAAPSPPVGYDAILTNYPYPFEVHVFGLRSQDQGLSMAYMDETSRSPNGHVVVLLHGANFTAAYWQRTIQALVDQGYRVIAPDQVGFGKSTKPVRYQFSFAALCDNTRRLLDSLGVHRVSLMGHSMGGMMAVRCALQNPGLVERLILVDPIGLEDWSRSVPYRAVEHSYHLYLTQTPDGLRSYMRTNYFGGNWSPAYETLIEPMLGWMAGPDRARIAWDRALVEDMIFTQPVVQEFPRLAQPTGLIIGMHDRTALGRDRVGQIEAARLGDYLSLGRNAAKTIPHARLVELPLAGHLPQVDSFDDYIRAVESFLNGEQ